MNNFFYYLVQLFSMSPNASHMMNYPIYSDLTDASYWC